MNYMKPLKQRSKHPDTRVKSPVKPSTTTSAIRSKEKENGDYVVLSKFEEDVVFEYHITISDEAFNLGILTMRTPEGIFETDFDE